MKMTTLLPFLALAVMSAGCSKENETSSESSTSTTSSSSSESSSATSTETTSSGTVYSTASELQAAMEAQTMQSNGLSSGSYFNKMYPYQRKYRSLTATSISDSSVTYDREIYEYDSSLSFNTSGNFWNGNLTISFGSTGWELDSSTDGLSTSQTEVINRIFSDYGSCTITNSSEINFLGTTYQGYELYCTDNSSKAAYSTVIPALPLWINPVQQTVYTVSGWSWVVNSSKTYYVFEYNP